MTEWGVKLWSTNTDHYLPAAEELYHQKQIDYIELYTVPGSLSSLPAWKKSGVPFVIHCAHSMHKFNLSLPEQYSLNKILLNEAYIYQQELDASAIIIHPGVLGSYKETIRQIGSLATEIGISPRHLLLENKPYITLTDDRTAASSPKEIEKILAATGTGFVLDITHAVKYAIAVRKNIWAVLSDLQKFDPDILHISDAHLNTPHDEHLHIGRGEFNFKKIFSCCSAQKISIETVKDNRYNLNDFLCDVLTLKEEKNGTIYRRGIEQP